MGKSREVQEIRDGDGVVIEFRYNRMDQEMKHGSLVIMISGERGLDGEVQQWRFGARGAERGDFEFMIPDVSLIPIRDSRFVQQLALLVAEIAKPERYYTHLIKNKVIPRFVGDDNLEAMQWVFKVVEI